MKTITWKIHLKSSPEVIFKFLVTAEGREKFWSEKASEEDGAIHFVFPNGERYKGRILKMIKNTEFHLDYFNSIVKYHLAPSGNKGTDLTLTNEGVSDEDFMDVHSGWVSVLLSLKAAVDFQIDLRNHLPHKTWNEKYVDN